MGWIGFALAKIYDLIRAMTGDNQEKINELEEGDSEADPSDEIETLKNLQEQLVSAHEHLIAEYDKLKRQHETLSRAYTSLQHDYNGQKKNADEYQKYGGSKIAMVLINALDMFKVALDMTKSIPDINQGLVMSYETMMENLKSNAINKIDCAIGTMPDPNLHFVVKQEHNDDNPSGSIVTILQDGYLIHDRILRPTTVVVAE